MPKPCEGQPYVDNQFISCPEPATTWRKDFRWGDRSKGEPFIVNIRVYFCQNCADDVDDNQEEALAEALGS